MYQYQYHCVPDFEPHSVPCETKLDDDDEHESLMPMSLANSSAETELLELVWRKGPVLSPLRGGARIRNPDPGGRADATLPVRADGSVAEVATQLFAEEDEMASWLNYHIGEIENGRGGDLCSATPRRPPPDANPARATGESTIVGSNLTPAVEPAKAAAPGSARRTGGFSRNPSSNWDRASSLRKRKTSDEDEFEYQSGEDGEFEFDDEKKDLRRSVAPRRSRAAEVHNLSERRRRDRINEKMKTLQELIPRCNKSDKASMLDEAIAYLKSLQLQVQMMSMGCSLNPVMFPGVQSFLQPMPMGTGMGMGMGMEMGMGIGSGNTMATEMQIGGMGIPVPSFGPLLPCLPLAASAQPQPLMASFHPPNCTNPDQVRAQANNQQALPFNSLCMQNPHIGQIQQIGDPYHYHLALNQQHQVLPQNKVTGEAGNSNKKEDKKGTKVG